MSRKPTIRIRAVHRTTGHVEHVASGWWEGRKGTLEIEGPYVDERIKRVGASLMLKNGKEITTGHRGEWYLNLYIDEDALRAANDNGSKR